MQTPEMRELLAFIEVARQLNFTRAALALNVSVPSFSQLLKRLEEKLGVRLLTRTTRSVSLTDAGAEFLENLTPLMEGFDTALDGLNKFKLGTGGRLRVLGSRVASMVMVGPVIGRFLEAHPNIEVEMLVDDLHLDLAQHRIDAGIQIGDRIEKGMIAVKLVDTFEEVLMASPSYIESKGVPSEPSDLDSHRCVRLRSSWDGTVKPWILTRRNTDVRQSAGAHFVANDLRVMAAAVIGGAGIGLLPPALVAEDLAKGNLVRVLDDWSSTVPGIYLFYPSRRQIPYALGAFIEFMKTNRPKPFEI